MKRACPKEIKEKEKAARYAKLKRARHQKRHHLLPRAILVVKGPEPEYQAGVISSTKEFYVFKSRWGVVKNKNSKPVPAYMDDDYVRNWHVMAVIQANDASPEKNTR
ncbi:hypothetical protein NDU88_005639 [Pleurodeles waltl]|uniref:Uncharacterized protein n=1 Tax=Pleurodeles waltl TaxID=8319 RepID=A0AAV7N0S4_PLEWA|nr:hypothetical protein NDU88_005639 [Pleurodeles waltl]